MTARELIVLVLSLQALFWPAPQTPACPQQPVTIKRIFVGPYAAAKAAQVQGTVTVTWRINPDGTVKESTINGSPALGATVDTWTKHWLFNNPASEERSVETSFRFRIEPDWNPKWGGQQVSGDLEHGFDIVAAPAYIETQLGRKP